MPSLPVPPSRRRFVWIVAATTALLAACSPPAPPPEPLRAVKLLTVGVGTLQAQQEYAGEVRARIESRLGFRVAGKLLQRPVELGDRVRPGQLLAQLDPQDYQLAAQAAQAQVAAAQTQQALAAADYQRYARLQAQNFISGAELERREASLKAAQASLAQAKAQAAAQGNQTTYTRLQADVAGLITGIEAEPGQVVTAGAPIVRIAHDGPRDVVFAVPEDKLAHLHKGQPVQVRPWAQGTLLQGQIRELAASADPITRTYAVKVALEGNTPPPPLGATVYIVPQSLSHAGQAAITLPTTALQQQGDATAVWVYDPASSTVNRQKIQIATADGNNAVVASGLTPGMKIVATGVHVLSPGQKVTIYQPKTGTAPSPAQTRPAP